MDGGMDRWTERAEHLPLTRLSSSGCDTLHTRLARGGAATKTCTLSAIRKRCAKKGAKGQTGGGSRNATINNRGRKKTREIGNWRTQQARVHGSRWFLSLGRSVAAAQPPEARTGALT